MEEFINAKEIASSKISRLQKETKDLKVANAQLKVKIAAVESNLMEETSINKSLLAVDANDQIDTTERVEKNTTDNSENDDGDEAEEENRGDVGVPLKKYRS